MRFYRINFSHKLVVPELQAACMDFLFSHAAGKPIKALRIAELFDEEELYREASRFVLDNPGGWCVSTLQKHWCIVITVRLGLTPN